MKYRTRQEIFNVAYRGLASQGFRQSKVGGSCRYRGDNGDRCAIGWCISDKDYCPTIEGDCPGQIGEFESDFIALAAQISDDDRIFAERLQSTHDCNHSGGTPELMQASLRDFAHRYHLTIPEGFDDLLTAQEPETGIPVTEPEAVA